MKSGVRRDWEEFRGFAKPMKTVPRAVLHAAGSFSLNKTAFELLGAPSHVVLLYDANSRAIGFKPSEPDVGHAYPVIPNSQSFYVWPRAFSVKYGLADQGKVLVFEPHLEGNVLVLELDKAEVTEPRRRSKN